MGVERKYAIQNSEMRFLLDVKYQVLTIENDWKYIYIKTGLLEKKNVWGSVFMKRCLYDYANNCFVFLMDFYKKT